MTEFSYNHLKENHDVGLLNKVFEFVENNIPYAKNVTPFIRKQGASLVKDCVIPLLTDWLNHELDLKTYVMDHLIREAGENKKNPLTLGEIEDKCKNIKCLEVSL